MALLAGNCWLEIAADKEELKVRGKEIFVKQWDTTVGQQKISTIFYLFSDCKRPINT